MFSTSLFEETATGIKTPLGLFFQGYLIRIMNFVYVTYASVTPRNKLCNSIKLIDINCRSWRILTQIPLEWNTTSTTWDLNRTMTAWIHVHVVCCVWASSVRKFLVTTLGNVRMKSPLGTQAQST